MYRLGYFSPVTKSQQNKLGNLVPSGFSGELISILDAGEAVLPRDWFESLLIPRLPASVSLLCFLTPDKFKGDLYVGYSAFIAAVKNLSLSKFSFLQHSVSLCLAAVVGCHSV